MRLRGPNLRNPKRLSVALGIAAAVLAAASLQYFARYQPLTALSGSGLQNGLAQVMLKADDVQVIGRDGGRPRWRMAAQTVTFSRDRHTIRVENIRQGQLSAEGGHPGISLTARHGVYQTDFGIIGGSAGSGTLRLDGAVQAVVLSRDRPSLRTEQLVWDSQQNTLTAPGELTATLPRLSVSAGNAFYSTPLGSSPGGPSAHGVLRLGGSVHALFQSQRGTAVFSCPGLLWSADQNTAQTLGAVTAQLPGGFGTASAGLLTANTRTGDLTGRDLQGTLRVSSEVQ